MENKKKNYWENKLSSMNQSEHLILAEILVEGLEVNEGLSKYVAEYRDYNVIGSKKARESLETFIQFISAIKGARKALNILEKFKELTPQNQRTLLIEFADLTNKKVRDEEQSKKENHCDNVGHDFGPWKKHEWTELITTYIDREKVDNYPINHKEWRRGCSYCGFVAESRVEPNKIPRARTKEEKEAKTKKLERQVAKLKQGD